RPSTSSWRAPGTAKRAGDAPGSRAMARLTSSSRISTAPTRATSAPCDGEVVLAAAWPPPGPVPRAQAANHTTTAASPNIDFDMRHEYQRAGPAPRPNLPVVCVLRALLVARPA